MAEIKIEEVEFRSGADMCAGRLYVPAKKVRHGVGVVLGHGLAGTMDSGLFAYAEAFAEAGFHALVFDYRNFGLSGGKHRQYISVVWQMQDWQAAMAHLRQREDIDAQRIGLWGMSFSGGHVLNLTQKDADIKAVVAQVPHIDTHLSLAQNAYLRGDALNMKLRKLIMADFRARFYFGKRRMVQVVGVNPNEPYVLAADEASLYPKIAGPSWRNEIDVRSFLTGKQEENNAAAIAQDFATPALLQMGVDDQTISNEAIQNFARRAGPIVTLCKHKCGHFGMLRHPHRARAIEQAIDFFTEQLVG